jgi:hypothetical protein
VVELAFVVNPSGVERPIGVWGALARGFDRVAAQPLLLVPPILLDLFFWFGPHLTVPAIMQRALQALALPGNAEPSLVDQLKSMQEMVLELGLRFNLLTALSSFPVGIPSLMAARLPVGTPLGAPQQLEIADPIVAILLWSALTIAGLGIVSLYLRAVAIQVAPVKEIASGAMAWARLCLLAAGLVLGGIVLGVGVTFTATLATYISPFLGMVVVFFGFSAVFWAVVYLAFTPHGIIRYRYGVLRAMMESVMLVRWNLLAVVAFLSTSFLLTWVTNVVWALPEETSWFAVLAILGHAFVSAMLVVSSYAFYQGRHQWLNAMRAATAAQAMGGAQPPAGPAG